MVSKSTAWQVRGPSGRYEMLIHLASATPIPTEAYYLDWFVALSLSAIGVFTPIAIALWRKAKKRGERLEALYVALLGHPGTLEDPAPVPGAIERLENLEHAVGEVKSDVAAVKTDVGSVKKDVAEVKREVTPNGGESNRLGDRVKRIESTISTTEP